MKKENNVYATTFLSKVSRKSDLISRLKELHVELSNLSQDPKDRPANLGNTAHQLISNKILGHVDKEVRLLAACCIVDILRVFAPDAPYDDKELCKVFEVINSQLRGLATHEITSGIGSKIYYILSSLAMVKSCVVVVVLTQNGVQGADELWKSLFESLITSIRPEHSDDVCNHMVTILQACIEESESNMEQDLLDVLLQPLLPSSKTEHPEAYKLCQTVLRRTTATLIGPISGFVNHVLVGAGTSRDVGMSELSDQIYPLIFELHKISPGLLLKVLPNICVQLHAEEEDVRLRAVKLLGRLFASQQAEYGTEFARNFREFLGRFLDRSAAVRLEMVECGSLIMKRKPELRGQVEEPLMQRLRDHEWDIRHNSLMRLLEVIHEDPLAVSAKTLREMGERVKDRKADIRKAAMVGLCKLYSRNIAEVLPSLEDEVATQTENGDIGKCFNSALWKRISFIPAMLINCWGYPDIPTRHIVLQLLQEYIIPKKAGKADPNADDARASPRAAALLLCFSSLSSEERQQFANIISFKRQARDALSQLLDARVKALKKRDVALSMNADIRRVSHKLNQLLPWTPYTGASRKASLIENLLEVKDKTVFKVLQLSVDLSEEDHSNSIDACCSRRDELKQRVDSKSALGTYCGLVHDFASFSLANPLMISALIQYSCDCPTSDAADLLAVLSKHGASIFTGSALELKQWMSVSLVDGGSRNKQSISKPATTALEDNTLKVVYHVAPCIAMDSGAPELCRYLLKLACSNSNVDLCERMGVIVCRMIKGGCECILSKAIGTLTDSKHMAIENINLVNNLSTLLGLVPSRDETLTAAKQHIIDFVTDDLLSEPNLFDLANIKKTTGASSIVDRNRIASAAITGLKLWAALVQSHSLSTHDTSDSEKQETNHPSRTSLSSDVILRSLLDTCFDCIRSEGRVIGKLSLERTSCVEAAKIASVSIVLKLLSLGQVSTGLSIEEWQTLGWSLLDTNKEGREQMLSTLCQVIQTSVVHPRFLVYPCLYASFEGQGVTAERALMFAIRRMRTTHEELCGRAMDEDDQELHARANGTMPECILPYGLHLLSHHPEFPSSVAISGEGDREKMNRLIRSVKMLLNVLLGSLVQGADNFSFLLKQVDMIAQHYEDAVDTENIGLHFVTRVARKVLKTKIKTAENVQPFPGDILLPEALYKIRDRVNDSIAYGLGLAPDGLEEDAEEVIELALKGATRARTTNTIRSPSAKRASKSKGKGKKRSKPVRDDDETDSDGDDELDGNAALDSGKSKSKATGVREKTRSGRLVTAVSYKEKGESEKEAAKWEAAAAKAATSAKQTTISSFFANNKNKAISRSSSVGGGSTDADADSPSEEIVNTSTNKSPLKDTTGNTERSRHSLSSSASSSSSSSSSDNLAEDDKDKENPVARKKARPSPESKVGNVNKAKSKPKSLSNTTRAKPVSKAPKKAASAGQKRKTTGKTSKATKA